MTPEELRTVLNAKGMCGRLVEDNKSACILPLDHVGNCGVMPCGTLTEEVPPRLVSLPNGDIEVWNDGHAHTYTPRSMRVAAEAENVRLRARVKALEDGPLLLLIEWLDCGRNYYKTEEEKLIRSFAVKNRCESCGGPPFARGDGWTCSACDGTGRNP
jgi:hypothetical protein